MMMEQLTPSALWLAFSFILTATLWGKAILPIYRRKPAEARSASHGRLAARFKCRQYGSPVLGGLSVIQSSTHKKGHMMKFIRQFKKGLYKSSWNTLQGLGAYGRHFSTTARTFESTLLLWADRSDFQNQILEKGILGPRLTLSWLSVFPISHLGSQTAGNGWQGSGIEQNQQILRDQAGCVTGH